MRTKGTWGPESSWVEPCIHFTPMCTRKFERPRRSFVPSYALSRCNRNFLGLFVLESDMREFSSVRDVAPGPSKNSKV